VNQKHLISNLLGDRVLALYHTVVIDQAVLRVLGQ